MSNFSYHEQRATQINPRITWGVQRLIMLNVAVFAVQLLWDPLEILLSASAYWPFAYAGRMTVPGGILNVWFGFQPDWFVQGFIYKPFTYQFMHTGLLHLFINMLWLFFFGPDVERSLGTRHFFRFYVLCGALGVLLTLAEYFLMSGPQLILVTGASGAVMGVMVAFAMIDPDRQLYLFPLPAPINARALILIIIAFNILGLLTQSQTSVATHFGGMLTGYFYMKFLPRIMSWQRANRTRRWKGKQAGTGKPEDKDKMGEAVDNIFKFRDRDRR